MTIIKNKNLSRRTLEGYHDVIFDGCNLSQAEPNTNPFVDCSNLEFRNGCNLNNMAVPEGSVTDGTNNNNQISFREERKTIEFPNADGSMTSDDVLIEVHKDLESSGSI